MSNNSDKIRRIKANRLKIFRDARRAEIKASDLKNNLRIELSSSFGHMIPAILTGVIAKEKGYNISFTSPDGIYDDLLKANGLKKLPEGPTPKHNSWDLLSSPEVASALGLEFDVGVHQTKGDKARTGRLNPFGQGYYLKGANSGRWKDEGHRVAVCLQKTLSDNEVDGLANNCSIYEAKKILDNVPVANLQHHAPNKESEEDVMNYLSFMKDVYNPQDEDVFGFRIGAGRKSAAVVEYVSSFKKSIEILGSASWIKWATTNPKEIDQTVLVKSEWAKSSYNDYTWTKKVIDGLRKKGANINVVFTSNNNTNQNQLFAAALNGKANG